MWDLTLPGYNYLGPFNKLNKGKPRNKSDAVAQEHDYGYDALVKEGKNPYTHWNMADEKSLSEWDNDYGGILAKAVFEAKKFMVAPFDPLKMEYKKSEFMDTNEPKGEQITDFFRFKKDGKEPIKRPLSNGIEPSKKGLKNAEGNKVPTGLSLYNLPCRRLI